MHPDEKQVPTIVTGRQRDALMIRSSWNLYTSKVLQATPPGAKRPHAWLVLFLENMLPLQQVDLI